VSNPHVVQAAFVAVLVGSAVFVQAAPRLDSGPVLFLDDTFIKRAFRLQRTWHQPEKFAGNPVIEADRPWEGTTVTFGSTLYDPQKQLFEMWYLAHDVWGSRHGRRPIKDSDFICYARSSDGVHWEKPALGLVEYQGSKDNNIVLRHQGSHFDSFSIIKVPGEPDPDKAYRLVAFQGTWPYDEEKIRKMGFSYKWPPAHYAFYSADGLHWKADYENPLFYLRSGDAPPGKFCAMDRTCFGYDTKQKNFLGFLKWTYDGKRVRRESKSEDFEHWTEPRFIFIPDDRDPPDMQFYGDYRFNYGKMYLGLLERYRTGPETIEIELVYSYDGDKWMRTYRPFVSLGPEGAWDCAMVMLQSSAPCEVGDELWFYYAGYDTTHQLDDQQGKIGLARLRRDGFCSMDAGQEPGRLTTVPLMLSGNQILLNADAAGGEIRADLREENGSAVKGFSRHDCRPITANGVRLPLVWGGMSALPKGRPLQLVLYMRNAKLYSIRAM